MTCPGAREHCWHIVGQWTDTGGDHISYKCCHCGSFKQEDTKPWDPYANHGPPVPNVWGQGA